MFWIGLGIYHPPVNSLDVAIAMTRASPTKHPGATHLSPKIPLTMIPLPQPLSDRIACAKTLRQHIRNALWQGDYEGLEATLLEHAQHAVTDDHANDLYRWLCTPQALFDPVETPSISARMALSSAWAQARPASYHAHLLLGVLWSEFAHAVDDALGLSTEDVLLVRRVASDNAWIVLLQAMALGRQPLLAYEQAMRLAGEFFEPDWLLDLFLHRTLPARNEALLSQLAVLGNPDWLPEVINTALAGDTPPPKTARQHASPEQMTQLAQLLTQLTRLTGEPNPLLPYPASLPAKLPARQTDAVNDPDDAWRYWLHRAMEERPDSLPTLVQALEYVDEDEKTRFIKGPLCLKLTDTQRAALWFHKAFDYLEEFADEDDAQAFVDQKTKWESLLKRPLSAAYRFRTLLHYGEFLNFHGKHKKASACAKEAALFYRRADVVCAAPELQMKNRLLAHIMGDVPDPDGVVPLFLAVGEAWGDNVWHMLLALAARQFALLGASLGPQDGQLARTLALLRVDPSATDAVTDVLQILWGPAYVQARMWLAHALGDNEVAAAQDFLADVYLSPVDFEVAELATPEHAQLSRAWRQRAANNGLACAKVKLVQFHLLPDGYQSEDRALIEQAKTLLEEAMDAGDDDAPVELFKLLMGCGTAAEVAWAHATLTPSLLQATPRRVPPRS